DDGRVLANRVVQLLAERILLAEQVLAHGARDDDAGDEARGITRGEGWLDLLVGKVAPGDQMQPERIYALLIHLVHAVAMVIVLARDGREGRRTAAAAQGDRVGRGRRGHPGQMAQVAEILLDRGLQVVALRKALTLHHEDVGDVHAGGTSH